MISRIVSVFLLMACAWTNVYAAYCQEGVPYGCECVHFVYDNGWTDFVGSGYAKNWFGLADDKGYETGSTPREKAVIVFKASDGNIAGHVGIMTRKVNHSEWRMDHANWHNDDMIERDQRVINSYSGNWDKVRVQWADSVGPTEYDIYGFIYGRESESDALPIRCSFGYCWRPSSKSDKCEDGTHHMAMTEHITVMNPVDKSVACNGALAYCYSTASGGEWYDNPVFI